jgi:outer membrane protein TolC
MYCTNKSTGHGRILAVSIAFAGVAISLNVDASGLGLNEVERLALRKDPSIELVKANRLALDELSVAAEQLPDPLLKLGMMSLPTDTFNLGQEAMTQVQVGLIQKFPRGHSRALSAQQIRQRSEGLDKSVAEQKLRILLDVREQFLETIKQQHLLAINAEAIRVFSELADVTQDYYATGKVNQGDVFQASVEMAKVEERAQRILQEEDRARARLATWVGDVAYQDFVHDWPALETPSSDAVIQENLKNHPRILALNKNIAASETGVELARQKYRPEFSLDVTYGGRSGTGPDGTSRPDLLSAMVVMDLPLFHKNRQDRFAAASIAQSSAAVFTRDDVYRRMLREIDLHASTLNRQQNRFSLYNTILVPESEASSLASFEAYQSSVGDLTTLLRAQITEFELRLEQARLQAEILKTQARLLYLEGESS